MLFLQMVKHIKKCYSYTDFGDLFREVICVPLRLRHQALYQTGCCIYGPLLWSPPYRQTPINTPVDTDGRYIDFHISLN